MFSNTSPAPRAKAASPADPQKVNDVPQVMDPDHPLTTFLLNFSCQKLVPWTQFSVKISPETNSCVVMAIIRPGKNYPLHSQKPFL